MKRTALAILIACCVTFAGCGGDDGGSEPVREPTILRLVASPPVTNLEGASWIEAVIAYPERMQAIEWDACVLLIDDPMDGDECPIPSLDVGLGDGARVRFEGWRVGQLRDYGESVFEALAMAADSRPATMPACVRDVAVAWQACVNGGVEAPWACTDEATWDLEPCIATGGVDVRIRARATMDDGAVRSKSRRVRFAEIGAPAVGNRNPILFSVSVEGQKVPNGGQVQASTGTTLSIVPNAFAESAETYEGPGGPIPEQLTYTWYRTDGDLDAFQTTYALPDNALTLPLEPVTIPITLWLFLDDDRGGADWIQVAIDPIPTP